MPIPIYKILAVVGFILFSSTIYVIQTNQQHASRLPDQYYSLPVAQHGLQAHIDPITNEFTRPTPQQRQSVQAKQTLPQTRQIREIYRPDGTVILDLQERYRLNGRESKHSGANNL